MTQINRDSRLLRLASSPLMVTIMVTVQRSPGGCVPLDRASLYRRCVETLLEWDASKGISAASTGLRTSQKAAILRRLAWALQSGEFGGAGTSTDREAVTELFESIMRNLGLPVELAPSVTEHLVGRTGLLVESAGRGLAFTHLSFQEYFVAEYLASHCGAEKFLEDPDQATGAWRDIFLLAVGMLPDATPLLGVAYRPDTADLFRDYLRLSANVITDATEIRDTLLVNKVLQECLEVASYGQFQMPEIVPGELRQYLLHHVGGFIGRYLSLRRYASGGPSFRTSILEQIRSWSLVDQIAGLDALKSCDLSASEIESILDFLAISDLTPSVAHILRKYANTHEPSPSMIRAVVQRAIATLGESNRSAQFQELFPLLARWRPVDPGLLVALRTAVSESIVFFIHAAFLLGMLSEDGVAVFEQMKSDRNIGTDLSGIERICMVAGALSAGLIPGCELVELARRYREDPRLLSRGKQYGLHLLTFGDPAVAVPCISDYINHSAYGYAAIGALFTLGGPALRETEKDALLALIRLNCCGNRSRKVVPRGRFIMAAGLLSQSHLLSSDELLELCEMAHPYVVKALTENLLITAHWAILAQMGDIYRRRVEQGTLPEDVEWCFIQRLAKAEWWTDPSGAAISILERYLTDKRWYFRSITLGAWTCTDSRPPMSPSVIKKVYASLSDSTGYGAPKGISADSPQVSAFYALAAEAILLGAWPTTGGSGRQIAGVVH